MTQAGETEVASPEMKSDRKDGSAALSGFSARSRRHPFLWVSQSDILAPMSDPAPNSLPALWCRPPHSQLHNAGAGELALRPACEAAG
jgi:hypothetical protein